MKFVNFHGRSHKVVRINVSRYSTAQVQTGDTKDVKPNLHSVTYYTGLLDEKGELTSHPSERFIDTGWAHTSQLSDEMLPEVKCLRPCC